MRRIQKILAFVLVAALLFGFVPMVSGAASAFTPAHSVVRIGLNAPNCWAVTPTVTLANSGGLMVGTFNTAREFVPSTPGVSFNTLTVTATGTTVMIRNAGGQTLHNGPGPIAIAPGNPTQLTSYTLPNASFGGNVRSTFQFFGGFRFTASGGNLTIVNYVDIEDYLKGVIPYEMPASWHIEALRAQAIAARTFTYRHMGRRNSEGFDLRNTTADQVYRGMGGSATVRTNQSVTDTRGMVMLHDGRPIGAYYFAASGGATENSSNVWSAQLPYLIGVLDPYETITSIRWERTLTAAEFRTHMMRNNNAAGFRLPNIVDVIPEYTAMGNMFSVTFVAANGDRQTYFRGDTRTRVNSGLHATFNSQRFTITRNQPHIGALDAADALYEAYQAELYTLEELYPYHSEAEIMEMAEAGLVRLHEASEEAIEALNTGALTFTVRNYGFGHNVGMSQWGASAMANAGYTFDQILCHYYTGITITGVADQPTPTEFADVSAGAWYHAAVRYVYERGFIFGVGGGLFAPYATATRAEFATIVARLEGVNAREWARPGTVRTSTGLGVVNVRSGPGAGHPSIGTRAHNSAVQIIGQAVGTDGMIWFRIINGTGHGYMRSDFIQAQPGPFSDVAPGAWYAPFVAWAAENGVVSGLGDGRFNPGGLVTRQEMATLLGNYLRSLNITLPGNDDVPPITDLDLVAWWAVENILAMQRAGIINGRPDGSFNPLGFSNRAEMAQIIANFHRIAIGD